MKMQELLKESQIGVRAGVFFGRSIVYEALTERPPKDRLNP